MAENLNLLNFKFGKHANLASQAPSAGTVYVTTDEQAMYIDLPDAAKTDGSLKRIRIGDIIIMESARDAKPPFAEGAIYYFAAENALLRWGPKADGTGYEWKQINSVSDVQADIADLENSIQNVILPKFAEYLRIDGTVAMTGDLDLNGKTIKNVKAPAADADAANKKYVDDEVATRVAVSDFNDFKTQNTKDIADAKKAGTDANARITDVVMPEFAKYLELEGGTMSGPIAMGANKITSTAVPSADADLTNKTYVDSGLAKKVNTADFTTFQTQNTKDIADAKKAGTDANARITDVVMPEVAKKLDATTGGTVSGPIDMSSKKITSLATPTNPTDAANKQYVDDEAAKKVNTSDFEEFETANAEAIADAKKAGTDADSRITKDVMPKFANYLLLSGGDMGGDIAMGSHKITTSAVPTAEADVTNKKYVDEEVGKKLDTETFNEFKTANDDAIADAKKAGTDAAKNIADVVMPEFAKYLPLSGGDMEGSIEMGNHKITINTAPAAEADVANKKYVDDQVVTRVKISDFNDFKELNDEAIGLAKKAGTDADGRITDEVMPKFNDYLLLSGGNLTGPLDMGGKKITTVADPTAQGDAVNKKYVDAEVGKKLDASTFEEFETTNAAAIEKAEKAGTDANKRITDVVMPEFNKYLKLEGGTLTGDLNVGANKVTSSAVPAADSDLTNKKYVDEEVGKKVDTEAFDEFKGTNTIAIAEAKKAGTDADKRITDTVMPEFAKYLPLAGGNMTGDINMGNYVLTVTTPTADNHAATKKYVDDAISANDAMTFKGVLGNLDGHVSVLPDAANVGDTYKVGVAGTYGGYTAKVGDLIINAAENDTDTPNWVHISAGYEDDYLQKMVVDNDTIHLTNGVDNSKEGSVSGLTFVGSTNSNLQFSVTPGQGVNPVHTVTASMVWGEF